jgi:hypothetical protein
MKTERNQLASVGRLHIWSLSDVLPEEEVFQSERIHREGLEKPILAEETPSFHSTTARSSDVQVMRVLVTRFYAGRKNLHQQVQIAAYRDVDHAASSNSGSRIMH